MRARNVTLQRSKIKCPNSLHMASACCRAGSVLQLSRLSTALQALSHRRCWRSVNIHPFYRLASSATSGEATKNVSVSIGDRLLGKDKDLKEVSAPHAGRNEQVSSDQASQSDGGSEKSKKDWKHPKKGKKEDVITKVLPDRGEARAVKFRLGKKLVTADGARERSLANEELIESEEGVKRAAIALPKNRAGHQMEETSKLVDAVTKNLSLTKKDRSLYSNALPSVFGTSVGGAKQVAMALNKAGLTKADVSTIFPKFPHILDIDYENVARVYTMLNEDYKMNRLYLVGLMRSHPYVFMMEEGVVRERMDALFELGLQHSEIASLLIHHPLLLSCPLSSETVDVAQEAMKVGLSSRWLAKSLSYNMHLRPARIKLQRDTRKLVELFEQYNVNMAEVFINQPKMLTMRAKEAEAVIRELCSHPLYLNSPDINYLLTRQPDLFTITDIGSLRSHLSLLCEVLGPSENVRYMFRSVANLLDPSCDIQGKVDLLTGKGFSKQDTFDLISQCPSLLTHDTATELKPKLEILMRVPGVVPTHLTKSPRSYFLVDVSSLQARYNFAKEHKEKLLKASRLDDIFCSTDREFAALCGVELSDYYEWTGSAAPLVRRRRKHLTTESKLLDDASLQLKAAQISAEDTTPLLTDIDTEEDEARVVSSGLESELDTEKEAEVEDGVGMRLALSSQGIFSEDFDSLLQYNDSPPPTPRAAQRGKLFTPDKKTTLKQSTVSSQLYHHHSDRHHSDLHRRHSDEAVPSEPPSLAKGSREATQLPSLNPPTTKASARGDNLLPNHLQHHLGPKDSTKYDSVFIEEREKELLEHLSATVGADFASCNNHNPSYMSSEATQMLPNSSSSTSSGGGGDDDSVCTFNGSSVGASSLENIMSAAVQLDLQGDSVTTASDSGHCEDGEDDECANLSGDDELGVVDLDSFASKEMADLLQELRRNLLQEEGGGGDGSRALQIKGMPRIGEIDEFIEDGLPLDLIEELDRNAHQFSSSM